MKPNTKNSIIAFIKYLISEERLNEGQLAIQYYIDNSTVTKAELTIKSDGKVTRESVNFDL